MKESKGMSMNQKEELRTQNMIRFIEAARELIDQEGLESLSIRKIAEKAGFHNSTIYLYFRDMDHLSCWPRSNTSPTIADLLQDFPDRIST